MTDYILNKNGSFMAPDEVVADLLAWPWHKDSIEMIQCRFQGSLTAVFLRNEFLRSIRNSYGLWSLDNPHTVIDAEPNEYGVIDHPQFPDNLGATIMERFMDAFQQRRGFTLDDRG